MNNEISPGTIHSENKIPAFDSIPWTWRDLFIVIGFTLGGLLISMLVLGVAYSVLETPMSDESLPIALFFLVGSLIYLALIFGVYRRTVHAYQLPWASLGVRPFNLIWLFALPIVFIVQMSGAAAVNLLVVAPLTGGEFENPQIEAISGGNPLTSTDFVLLFILIAVLAPIAEELFFRGMLYPLLRKHYSQWPAIIIDAGVFAVVHFLLVLVPALFIIGICLTWLRARSQSVLPSIFLHMLQNGLAMVTIYLFLNGVIT